jgi:predicted nucleic-acid-binding protein
MKIVDANIVLRYVLDDHPQLSLRAADILENNEVFLPFEIACEVVYVLQKVYHVARKDIQNTLSDLLESHLVKSEKPTVLKKALEIYCTKNLDIVDAILCAYNKLEGAEVFTFDDKLQRCFKSPELSKKSH